MKYLNNVFLIYSKKYKKKYYNKWKNYPLQKDYEIILDKMNNSHNTNKKIRYNSSGNFNKVNYPTKNPKTTLAQENFLSRQEVFSQRVKEHKQKNETRQEEELRLLYTFSPKVNTSTSFSKKNAIEYNNNVSPLMKENGGQNVRKSNPFDRLYKNSGIKAKKSNSLQFSSFSKLDNKKKRPKTSKRGHEKLYKDYKEYENKKKNLQKEIDMERGITFKPKCYTANSGYNVESNFEERNKKLIEDRNNFVFVYDYLRQCKFNEHVLGNGNKLLQNYLVKNNNDIENLIQSQRIANQMMMNNINYSNQQQEGEEEQGGDDEEEGEEEEQYQDNSKYNSD